jgi:hypothetical protein
VVPLSLEKSFFEKNGRFYRQSGAVFLSSDIYSKSYSHLLLGIVVFHCVSSMYELRLIKPHQYVVGLVLNCGSCY